VTLIGDVPRRPVWFSKSTNAKPCPISALALDIVTATPQRLTSYTAERGSRATIDPLGPVIEQGSYPSSGVPQFRPSRPSGPTNFMVYLFAFAAALATGCETGTLSKQSNIPGVGVLVIRLTACRAT
jgi:hypothetical protein